MALLTIALFLILMLTLGEYIPFLTVKNSRIKRWTINIGSLLLASLLAGAIWWWPNQFWAKSSINIIDIICPTSLAPLRVFVLLLLYDLSLWIWHRAMHVFPWLWHIHYFHHLDPELDATTGLRFHPLEFILSGFWRWGLLWAIGPDVLEWTIITTIASLFAIFHHSRFRLPTNADRVIRGLFVTPTWHQAHHNPERIFHDGHYSVIFTIWDRIFRTWHLPNNHKIGLSGYTPNEGTMWKFLWKKARKLPQ
jgi:sterol desaturase/sphingolipid hydroxylase (fatty acid hydroxylase superfamily)